MSSVTDGVSEAKIRADAVQGAVIGIDVFLSVGRTTPDQESFVAAVESYLQANDLRPRTVGRIEFSSEQPLKRVQRLMRECSGAVILAYERLYIQDGIDRRGSDAEEALGPCSLPTVWNQIEAAMAYTLGRPLLVMVEVGLRDEGLLEPGHDWYVQRIQLEAATLAGKEFLGVFADWKQRVVDFHQSRLATEVP
jgi:hypothetical protein